MSRIDKNLWDDDFHCEGPKPKPIFKFKSSFSGSVKKVPLGSLEPGQPFRFVSAQREYVVVYYLKDNKVLCLSTETNSFFVSKSEARIIPLPGVYKVSMSIEEVS